MPIHRVINGGGIPRKNPVLNQVYANVLGKPVLVPEGDATSLGSAIFAFLAAGTFATIEEAQAAMCPPFRFVEPQEEQAAVYRELYRSIESCIFRWASGNRGRWRSAGFSRIAPSGGAGARREECWNRYELKYWKPISNWCAGLGDLHLRQRQRRLARNRLIVIRPSGVPYENDRRPHGDRRPELQDRGGKQLTLHRTCHPRRPVPRLPVDWRRRPYAPATLPRRRRPAANSRFGTTHADYFHGPVPVTDPLTARFEIESDYEANTGRPFCAG